MVILEETNNNQRHLSSSQSGFVTTSAGPYDEDSSLILTCQADFDDPTTGAQIGWWHLSSVSVLPANGLVIPSSSSSPSSQRAPDLTGATKMAEAEYMTTVSVLARPANAELDQMNPAAHRSPTAAKDYLVGLHSSPNPLEQNLVIPFTDGHQLKHWTRVKSERQQSSQPDKLQASVQLSLARSHLDNEFLCLAANNDFSAPLNSTVKINLNRKCHWPLPQSDSPALYAEVDRHFAPSATR